MTDTETRADVRLPTADLQADLPFFTESLGMRLMEIFPADNPSVAVIAGHGLRVCLVRDAANHAGTIRILTTHPDHFANGARVLNSPGGTRVEIDQIDPPLSIPEPKHSFVVRRLRDEAPWVIGRAGMHYRDLIPDRLGGSIIASHIRIPDGGPVPDMVHYHQVGFQLIFCYRGWVDLVYEDQGEPMRLHGGDCVIQPPRIRHRVLAASADIEVIEIGVPAEHVTTIDHDMTLPNGPPNPERVFEGQRFVHHRQSGAPWRDYRLSELTCRDTGIAVGTNGVAGVVVVRRKNLSATRWTSHNADMHFTFVMDGTMSLEGEDHPPASLEPGDAFVIPPGMRTRYAQCSPDLELLEVALPGTFDTTA